MNRKYIFIGILLLVIILGGGIWLWNWVLGDTQAASGPITAVPVVTETATIGTVSTEAPLETTNDPVVEETPVESAPLIFQINQEDSQAAFTIFEELRGQPKDVVGTTNQIAGEIALTPDDPSTAQVGVIQVNARLSMFKLQMFGNPEPVKSETKKRDDPSPQQGAKLLPLLKVRRL